MSPRKARPDIEGGMEVFRYQSGRHWWGIRMAEPPDGIARYFGAYLHRKADGVALRTLILDVCPERNFGALLASALAEPGAQDAAVRRIRELETVARLVWARRNKSLCIRCGDRHHDDRHNERDLLSERDVAWAAPVRVSSPRPASTPRATPAPDVEGGLEVVKDRNGREWVVRAAPIAGRGAAFGTVNRKRDALALRDVLLEEVPNRDFAAMFNEHGKPLDAEVSRPVYLRLKAIGEAANWVAWRQRNGVCLECGMQGCGSAYTGACDPEKPADRFRGGRIPAELRRWAA